MHNKQFSVNHSYLTNTQNNKFLIPNLITKHLILTAGYMSWEQITDIDKACPKYGVRTFVPTRFLTGTGPKRPQTRKAHTKKAANIKGLIYKRGWWIYYVLNLNIVNVTVYSTARVFFALNTRPLRLIFNLSGKSRWSPLCSSTWQLPRITVLAVSSGVIKKRGVRWPRCLREKLT